jgi:predicted DNA-binding mobile mystery protein A
MYLFTFKFNCKLNLLQKMRNKRKLLIEQLDQKLQSFQKAELVLVPNKGWIHTIRTALNMTMAQLGARLKITRQGVKSIEESESKGSISINSLKEVGDALDLKFVYGFVPKNGTIDNLVNIKAEKLARKIALRTHQNMKLEDQGIGDEKINGAIKELADEIKREMRRSLWD